MEFEFSEEQKLIARTARDIAKKYDPAYWREKENEHKFGQEFWDELAKAGFQGLLIPEAHGGAGLGMLELSIAMEELAAGGCGMAGVWYLVLTEIFGGTAVMKHGTEAQKRKYLPKIADGSLEFCLALTEPDAGTNTLNTRTRAVQQGDKYIVNGDKIFISGADRAGAMVLVTRTTPRDEAPKRSLGLTLFLVDLPNPVVDIEPIAKHGINYSKTCEMHIDDLELDEGDILGEKDKGWYHVLDTLNPERISFAAAAIGIGKLALRSAVDYAKERKVFGRPIGEHQAIQFPLAMADAKLECSRMMNYKAAWLYDNGKQCGRETNTAKAAAVEAGIEAVYHAMQTFGGYGYATDYDVERWWREIQLVRLAPVTQQMALAYIGQHVLGLPKSY